jgi:beta-glucosidase
VEKAMNSDLVIFVGGLNKNHFQDCEGGDRLSYELPFAQNELIEALLKVNKKGSPKSEGTEKVLFLR